MRIGITCYPTYGGSGAVATELGMALGRRGHKVHIISYDSPFRLRGFAENVYFHQVDMSGTYPLLEYPPYSLALAVKQHEVAIKEQLDVLHVHYAVPHATAAFLAREMTNGTRDLKVVTTLHGTDITLVGQEKSFFTVTKFSIERSDAVTAVSNYLREETYRAFGCELCGIEVIPNFINLDEYSPSESCEHRQAFADQDTKIVLHVSNFRPVKRLPVVIDVFDRIQKEVPAVLVLVGDGPDRPEVEAEVERRGLQDRVRLLGQLNVVADVMRAADLFLMPSRSESFGLGALEAMACGVPVVASRVGGLPEVVVDGETGALVDPADNEGMARRAIEILSDDALAKRYREGARARAATFSTDKIVPLYEDLYKRVIA